MNVDHVWAIVGFHSKKKTNKKKQTQHISILILFYIGFCFWSAELQHSRPALIVLNVKLVFVYNNRCYSVMMVILLFAIFYGYCQYALNFYILYK